MRISVLLVAAACLLAAPLAAAAQCGLAGTSASAGYAKPGAGSPAFYSSGAQLIDEVKGHYVLSNGHRLDLIYLDGRLVADFDRRKRVNLHERFPHRFASRGGEVQLTWLPDTHVPRIVVSYPADSSGRFTRRC